MDYVLTDQGRAFLRDALTTCDRFSLSWYQLWSKEAHEADEARQFLDFSPEPASEDPDDTAKLLGTYAVVHMLQNIAAGNEDPKEGIALLRGAALLTNDVVEAAAATIGLSSAELWDIFVPNP